MLYQESEEHPHISLIRKGLKTETRRQSDRWGMKPGNVYPIHEASKGLFQERTNSEGYVLCIDRWEEPLKDITVEGAYREGRYTRNQFFQLWKELNGEKDLDKNIKVYRFGYVGDEDPGLNPGRSLTPLDNTPACIYGDTDADHRFDDQLCMTCGLPVTETTQRQV